MAVKSLSVLLLLAVAAQATLEVDVQKVNADLRVDNLQDPTINVTVAGGPATTLFDSCATQAFTFSARLYSIVSAAGQTYNRYVPAITYNVTFTTASSTTPIKSTIDCADYAGSVGASMFMYDGSKCQYVNNTVYDTTVPEDCDSAAKQAVFVREGFNGPCGPLPSFSYVSGSVKECYKPIVTQALFGVATCTSFYGLTASSPLTYQQIKQSLMLIGVSSDLFFDYNGKSSGWEFQDGNAITAQDFANGTLPEVVEYKDAGIGDNILYMSAADGFKLKMGPKVTTKAGLLCEDTCSTC